MLPATAVGLVLAAATAKYMSGPKNTIYLKGGDGNGYTMQNLPNASAALERIVEVRRRLEKLAEYYASEPIFLADPACARFLANFRPDAFVENDMSSSSTSYSENKGQRIVVCLRDKQRAPEYPVIDINTIMFVMLHETSHLMTETIGHTNEFWNNFKRVLHDAVKLGIYTSVNYASSPTPYCGMKITDTPI